MTRQQQLRNFIYARGVIIRAVLKPEEKILIHVAVEENRRYFEEAFSGLNNVAVLGMDGIADGHKIVMMHMDEAHDVAV